MYQLRILYYMSTFQNEEQFYQVVRMATERLAEIPERTASFSHSNLVLRICLTNPTAELLLDGRQPPLEVFYGKSPGEANITLTLEADLLHELWLGKQDLRQMLFNGQIQTTGNLLRAVPIIDMLTAFQEVYP